MVYTRSQYQRKMESEQEQLATPVGTQNVNPINSVLSEQNANNEPENELHNLFLENTDDNIADEVPSVPSPVPSMSKLDRLERIMLSLQATFNQKFEAQDSQYKIFNQKLDEQQQQTKLLQNTLNKKLDERLQRFERHFDEQDRFLENFGKTLDKQQPKIDNMDLSVQNLTQQDENSHHENNNCNEATKLSPTVLPEQLVTTQVESEHINCDETTDISLTVLPEQHVITQVESISTSHEENFVENVIKQQLEQKLPNAVPIVSQQIYENQNSADDNFKAEIETLEEKLESVTDNEVHSVVNTPKSVNNSPFDRLTKKLRTDGDEGSQSGGGYREANNDDYGVVRRVVMTSSNRLVENKPFRIFSPERKKNNINFSTNCKMRKRSHFKLHLTLYQVRVVEVVSITCLNINWQQNEQFRVFDGGGACRCLLPHSINNYCRHTSNEKTQILTATRPDKMLINLTRIMAEYTPESTVDIKSTHSSYDSNSPNVNNEQSN